MPKGKGYGALQGSPEAIKSLISQSNQAAISRGILELGSSLRTADRVKANKKKFQGGIAQTLFNKMGAKLYGQSIRGKYNKSGFKTPTGSELVAGYNKSKADAQKIANKAQEFQPASGQTRVKNFLSNNPINSINSKNIASNTPKSGANNFKSQYKANNKKGDIEGFNARMRAIHKARGIKVKDKSKYRAYMGY